MVLENSHLTSQGLHAVFKCDGLARGGREQLDQKCAQNDRVQSYMQPRAGNPYA